MLQPKKRITKRELKQDALITSYVKATTFYEEHKKNIGIGIVAVVVIVLGTVLYVKNQKAENEKATTELGSVFQLYDTGQYVGAINGVPERNIAGLRAIVDNYGSTPSGQLARFYLANCYFFLGRYEEALKEFESFSPPDDLLASSRLAGIGATYEALGNHTEAAQSYEKAARKYPKDVDAAENLHRAAWNYGEAGQKERAIELYRRLKKEYPTTTFGRDADKYIARFSV
jgi:tetratricopeptide (TPR) repeat protein